MKKTFTRVVGTCFILLGGMGATAQCPVGYTAAELNWDHVDFLPSNNARYTGFYPVATFPYEQNFVLATRTINFKMAPATGITLNGENGNNTAHAGSFATAGDDVQFTTTVATTITITMMLDAEVANFRFSVFDLDNGQRIRIAAVNDAGVAQNIDLTNANAGSGITINGSGSSVVDATGPAAAYANNDNMGTINIDIDGPVKQVVVSLDNAAGDIWLSDIDACVTGSFPNNYQQISRPFTGQPGYVLAVVNNNIYYIDPTNGRGYFLFNEPGHNRLNSMAYDPYKRVVYYTYSLTGGTNPRTDKTLKKYDVDSKTISVVIPNVNTFGIPTYESGVESGSATFYNGSLYLGIEGYTGTQDDPGGGYAAGRKSTIWKINFDAAGNAIPPAAQVFGITSDNGVDAQNIHDWSDFAISNGVLYDFDGSNSGDIDFYHFNLMTGVRTRYAPVGLDPKQVSIGWDEKIYDVDASLALYNGTNGVGTRFTINAPLGPVIPTGSAASWGDAAGPYRPFLDFGDAPASYDPDPWSPACHDTLTANVSGRRTKLILGPNEDVEWLKKGFTTIEDNYEDGLTFIPVLSPPSGSFVARTTVLNNTGSNATVCAWLDLNGNGVFDPAEGITPITVPSSATVQTVNLSWTSLPSILPNGSYTYLRIRITSASFGMTTSNATGYYSTGEVEDYRIRVDYRPLPLTLLSFDAKTIDTKTVQLSWSANEEEGFAGYLVERSLDGSAWEQVATVPASIPGGVYHYKTSDDHPYTGRSWYRLQLKDEREGLQYSQAKMVNIRNKETEFITLWPNPARGAINLLINNTGNTEIASINIVGMHGGVLHEEKLRLGAGNNAIQIPLRASWPAGIYIVRVMMKGELWTRTFMIGP